MNSEIIITVVCAALLIMLVVALIFRKDFRDAVLGNEGEATIIGLVTVKGVSVVLLAGMFLAGMVYPLTKDTPRPFCESQITKIETLLHAKFRYEIEEATKRSDRTSLEKMINDLKDAVQEAKDCVT